MPATANHRFWIDMSLECVRRDHTDDPGDQRGPFRTARALGMALAAPHEVRLLAAGRPPLLALSPAPDLAHLTASELEVACCAACAEVLTLRYPHQTALLAPAWPVWLLTHGHGPAGGAAETLGRAVGRAIHAIGADDAKYADPTTYKPSGLPYTHEAPPNEPGQRFAGADWGYARRLLTAHVDNFPSPPARQSATFAAADEHYRQDYARVLAKGEINATHTGVRSHDEEFIGIAWGYDGPRKLGTPPRLYMQAVLSVLDRLAAPGPTLHLSTEQELEIVAGVGLAMAEAGIDAWYYKYAPTHMMWRPAVGIRKAIAAEGTTPDPHFLPLGRPDTNQRGLALTPDFPAYPSGHATFGAAAFDLLRLYLAHHNLATLDDKGVDNLSLNFVSDEFNGVNTDPRTQKPRCHRPVTTSSLWQAIVHNSVSRVYLGVHWQFDGLTERQGSDDVFAADTTTLTPAKLGRTGGVWLGMQIARQVAARLGVSVNSPLTP